MNVWKLLQTFETNMLSAAYFWNGCGCLGFYNT